MNKYFFRFSFYFFMVVQWYNHCYICFIMIDESAFSIA